eukprot:scaffold29584_cov83-Skeletonema_dohrnii-CCMP3373.AAC.1
MVGGFEAYLDMLKRKARQENTPLIYLFIRLTIPRLAIQSVIFGRRLARTETRDQRPETEEIFVRSRRVVVAMMWGLEDEVGWTGLAQPWMIYD